MGVATRVIVAACLLGSGVLGAQTSNAARQIVDTMVMRVNDPADQRYKYMYLSEERSERTGGHLWRERVVETSLGKVRLLLAEDGRPLSPERMAAEKARLVDIVAHPDAFRRREETTTNDENHAVQMLSLLRTGFLFDEPRAEGGDIRIGFRPDPAYQPKTMEEKVLHAMSGTVLVDERAMQLHRIEGRIPSDVTMGYGLLGTIHAGSSFSTEHQLEPGGDWKDTMVTMAIEGKALFFKEIGRSEHLVHSEYQRVSDSISVAEAVALVQR
jgi:hypothetical protein